MAIFLDSNSYKLWQKCSYEANIDGYNTICIIILFVYRNHILKLVNIFPICSWWRNYIIWMVMWKSGYLVSPIERVLNINDGRFTQDLYKIIVLKIYIEQYNCCSCGTLYQQHPKVSQKWQTLFSLSYLHFPSNPRDCPDSWRQHQQHPQHGLMLAWRKCGLDVQCEGVAQSISHVTWANWTEIKTRLYHFHHHNANWTLHTIIYIIVFKCTKLCS